MCFVTPLATYMWSLNKNIETLEIDSQTHETTASWTKSDIEVICILVILRLIALIATTNLFFCNRTNLWKLDKPLWHVNNDQFGFC